MDFGSPPFSLIPRHSTLRWHTDLTHENESSWYLDLGFDQIFWLKHGGVEHSVMTFDLNDDALYDPFESLEVVVNFECSASPASGMASMQLDIPAWLEDESRGSLTFIFHDNRTEKEKPPPANPDFIVDLLQSYPAAGTSINLVGLENFIRGTRTMEMFKQSVFRGFVNHRAELVSGDPEDYEDVCGEDWKLVCFLTMQEYEEEVGHERFIVHTVK